MHHFESFPALGPKTRAPNTETTFWPTFTDIMTVILMVFMLTMIVVIIKNANLADQLLFSQNKKLQVEKSLQQSRKMIADQKISITNLEEKLRAKEMEIILLGDEAKLLESNLESKLAIVSSLKNKISELNKSIQMLQTQFESKEAEVLRIKKESDTEIQRIKEASEEEMQRLKEVSEEKIAQITEETKRQIAEFNLKMLSLLSRLEEKESVIITLDSEKEDLELSLAKQRQEYSSLEEKYIKLIRPARSSVGKKVVTIQYSRTAGKRQILFKDINAAQFRQIDLQQLHALLGRLKKVLTDKLYVKIVIPEKSGLSYNEAWSFTKDILTKYDYYYQEKPEPAPKASEG